MTATAAAEQLVSVRPAGHWTLAWRRLRRDHVAMASGIFLLALLFGVFPGAPLYEKAIGHGPNDLFPYAVTTCCRPVGPLCRRPRHADPRRRDPIALEHKPPPKGTPRRSSCSAPTARLGRDELLRLLYGGRVSLEVAIGAAILALLIGLAARRVGRLLRRLVDAIGLALHRSRDGFPMLLFLLADREQRRDRASTWYASAACSTRA